MIVALHGIVSSSNSVIGEVELTIEITGLPEDYEVYVDNILWVDKKKSFPVGTILLEVTPIVEGYTLVPTSVSSVTLDISKTLSFTATPLPEGRLWSLDMAGQFSDTPLESGITWNTWKATNEQLAIPDGYILSNMLTESNEASTLSVTNADIFDGSANQFINYSSLTPVYPKVAVESGITLQTPTILRFSGADPSKTYNVSVLSCTDIENTSTKISNGVQNVTKSAYNNLPADGDSRYTSSALMQLTGIVSDAGGVFDINIEKAGSYYLTAINLILIQEV